MKRIKKFLKDNWWAIATVVCFAVLGMVLKTAISAASDVIVFYVTHALIAD